MNAADLPANEQARLAALREHSILDTPPDDEFDALTRLAAAVCGVPIAAVSLVDAERQWFKSAVGLPGVGETPREVAFCAHTILDSEVFEVQDTHEDDRFQDNPLVTGAPLIRFYAGAPVIDDAGYPLGTVCVIDRVPRALSAEQKNALRDIAMVCQALIRSRDKTRSLAITETEFQLISAAAPIGIYRTDTAGRCTFTNAGWQAITGLSRDASRGYGWLAAIHPEDLVKVQHTWSTAIETRQPFGLEFRCLHRDGSVRWVLSFAQRVENMGPSVDGYVGVQVDITERKELELKLGRSLVEKSCLLEEIHHRVKNNLQVIQSMLDMQEARFAGTGAAAALRDAQNRIRAIALIHCALYRSPDLARLDLADILREIAVPLAELHNGTSELIEFRFDTEPVPLPLEQVIPCGLIVNELVTNSIKHGYPAGGAGKVHIVVRMDSLFGVRITITDDGIGMHSTSVEQAFNGGTLGLKLVKLLVDDLDGQIAVASERGTSVSVTFTASNEGPETAPTRATEVDFPSRRVG